MKRLFMLSLAVLCHSVALAAPVAVAKQDGVTVTLYNEPCKLAAVDLPHRATWVSEGKAFAGCAGLHAAFPIVVLYFADRSIAIVPVAVFAPLSGV